MQNLSWNETCRLSRTWCSR